MGATDEVNCSWLAANSSHHLGGHAFGREAFSAFASARVWFSQGRRRQGEHDGVHTTQAHVFATRFPAVAGVVILVVGSPHQERPVVQPSTAASESKPGSTF